MRGMSAIAGRIIRDFSDPYIELIRLVHEASIVEHALMVRISTPRLHQSPPTPHHGLRGAECPTICWG